MPGPGNYNPNERTVKQHAPTWRFGSGIRETSKQNNNPGPGNYSITRNIGSEAPKYSLTARNFYSGGSASNPGPGQYNNESNLVTAYKAPTWKIGSSTRDDSLNKAKKEAIPGPGNYNVIKNETGNKYSFGKDQRVKSASSGSNPGPGQYKIPASIFNVPTFIHGAWDKTYKFV